jgi:hypothetical protein
VIDVSFPHPATELRDETEVTFTIFETRNGCLEVTSVRETEGPDRAKVRQPQMLPVVLADETARRPIRKLDTKLDATRDQHDMPGWRIEDPEFCVQDDRARLRDDQKFSVSVIEKPIRMERLAAYR